MRRYRRLLIAWLMLVSLVGRLLTAVVLQFRLQVQKNQQILKTDDPRELAAAIQRRSRDQIGRLRR
jgi:hypothetical protein